MRYFLRPVPFAYWQEQTTQLWISLVCVLMLPFDALSYILLLMLISLCLVTSFLLFLILCDEAAKQQLLLVDVVKMCKKS